MSAKPICPQCHYWILNRHLDGAMSCRNCGWRLDPVTKIDEEPHTSIPIDIC
jgi:ribosomal protein L37AE/L43A